MKQFKDAWSKLLNPVMTVLTVASCGINLSNSGMVLIGNTQCLAQDFDELIQSQARLDQSF